MLYFGMSENNGGRKEFFSNPETTGLDIVKEVDKKISERFGCYKEDHWKPSEGNVFILSDEEYDKKVAEYTGEAEAEIGIGYSHTNSDGTGFLFVRKSQGNGLAFKQTVAHEELHLWFKNRHYFNGDKSAFSFLSNETFVDILSIEGLGIFDLPLEQLEPSLKNRVEEYLILQNDVFNKIGEDSWKYLFKACDSGDLQKISYYVNKKFGRVPSQLKTLDQKLENNGENFWGRCQEIACAIQYFSRNMSLIKENKDYFNSLVNLIRGWSLIKK